MKKLSVKVKITVWYVLLMLLMAGLMLGFLVFISGSVSTQTAMDQLDRTVRDDLGTQFCRRCNYCQPCTAGISISNVFLFQGYLRRYGLGDWAKNRYSALEKKASDCVDCGLCESRCPYNLPIREMLKAAAKDFGV